MSDASWIGVDLDGTLAQYDGWKGDDYIGEPVKKMQDRVLSWLNGGMVVKIVTARPVHGPIKAWCVKNLGREIPIQNYKDFSMIEMWDDRAVAVEKNTGNQLSPSVL